MITLTTSCALVLIKNGRLITFANRCIAAPIVADICKIPVTTLMKVVQHAQRTPKSVNWDVISNKIKQ